MVLLLHTYILMYVCQKNNLLSIETRLKMLFSLKMTRTNDTTSKSYILWWSNILQNSAIFCNFLQVFASFCKFQQDSTSFCKFLFVSISFLTSYTSAQGLLAKNWLKHDEWDLSRTLTQRQPQKTEKSSNSEMTLAS